MSEKLIGYLLLAFGVITVLFSALSVYQVFTNRIQPIALFSYGGISIDLGKALQGNIPDLQNTDLKQELVSSDMLNRPLNLAAHVFLMSFVAGVGYKLASLGIQLLRPIVVKMKESTSK